MTTKEQEPARAAMSGAVELEAELRAEIERYIARCREMSEGGKYSWWTRLAEILATLRADNERLGRERDADIDALHGTFSKPIAVLQERVAAAEAERDTLLAQVEMMRGAIDGIYIYANDTLSGRADGGPDDRAWQRAAVVEIRNRARVFATVQSAVDARAALTKEPS